MKLKSIILRFSCVLFFLSACTNVNTESRAGNWQYFSDIGNFTITVSPDGNSITSVSYKIACGQQKPSGSYKLTPETPGTSIAKNKFNLSIGIGGAVTITNWKATFNRDGTKLTGTWSVLEGLCSKEFEITR